MTLTIFLSCNGIRLHAPIDFLNSEWWFDLREEQEFNSKHLTSKWRSV